MTREPVGSLAEEAVKLVSALSSISSSATDDPHDHDPLAPECRYCPICAVGRAARSVTPEVREHLASAAMSMVLALKGFLDEAASSTQSRDSSDPVEKIDLSDDTDLAED